MKATFESQVLGPCFEAMARYWSLHFADPATLGGPPDHVGPTTVSSTEDSETELDVVVAAADARAASERSILAIGEAKAGERISERPLPARRLGAMAGNLAVRLEIHRAIRPRALTCPVGLPTQPASTMATAEDNMEREGMCSPPASGARSWQASAKR